MKTKLNVGDWFELKGFLTVAALSGFDGGGEAVVLSNESDHYLVAFRFDSRATAARLAATFRYSEDGPTCESAYVEAVNAAARLAVAN